jgi:hypothetical protein
MDQAVFPGDSHLVLARAKIRAKPSRALAPVPIATPVFRPANAVFAAAMRESARKRESFRLIFNKLPNIFVSHRYSI